MNEEVFKLKTEEELNALTEEEKIKHLTNFLDYLDSLQKTDEEKELLRNAINDIIDEAVVEKLKKEKKEK